jgi:putative ABC transport system permease protein
MLSLHRTLSVRHLRRRLGRSLLVVLSIALGVATLVGTRCLSQNMALAAQNAANPLAGSSDLLITNGESGVPRALAGELRATQLPGVAGIHPLVVGRGLLPERDNRSVLLMGADVESAGAADFAREKWGLETQPNPRALLHFVPKGTHRVFLGKLLDADFPEGVWDFTIRVGNRTGVLSRAGTVDAHGPAAALGGSVVFLQLADAADLVGHPDLVTRIDVTLDPGADREQARRLLQEAVGSRAQVETPQVSEQSVNDLMTGMELGFTLGGICALVVGLFLVYNALSVSVAERRHDIGILRSLGATRAQVAGLFTGEACALGLVGSALGVPLGWGLAYAAVRPFQQTLSEMAGAPIEMSRLPPLGWDTIALALAAGTATALLAALVPALSAAWEEPADAVRRAPSSARAAYRVLHAAVCVLLILTGLTLVVVRDRLPPRIGSFGAIVFLLPGMLVATPLLTAAAVRLLRPAFRHLLGVTERLAADNLARSPGRTGLVIGALAAGIALVVQNAGVTASSEDAALTWVDRSIAADLFVTAYDPASPGTQNLTMDDRVGRLLASLPEIQKIVPVRFRRVNFRDNIMVYLIALDAAEFYTPERLERPMPGLEVFRDLHEPGTAMVSENFAALHHVKVGDRIPLQGPHGPVEFRVIGTLLDYSWNRGSVFLDREQYARLFEDDHVDIYEVYVRPDAEQTRLQLTAALSAAPQAPFLSSLPWQALGRPVARPDAEAAAENIRRRWGAQESLFVQTRGDLRDTIRAMIRRMSMFSYAQEVVVIIVAALGVVMALLISVLQRQRELGLLRAVGASRSQVLRSVLAEAALMGVVGSLIGTLFGIPLEWYALHVILLDEAGFTFPAEVPWAQVAAVVLVGMSVATLAGLLPALRAVRLRIADAIAYE